MSNKRHHRNHKPKTTAYPPNSIGGMVDVLEIKKKLNLVNKNDNELTQIALQGKGDKK